MREIKYIVVHCTATSQKTTIASIMNYWTRTLKWSNPGYHYIYEPSGNEVQIHGINRIANGVANYNSVSIHLSYIGGVDGKGKSVDNRTPEQKEALLRRIKILKAQFPNAIVQGHRDFPKVPKDCPCFDAKQEYANI